MSGRLSESPLQANVVTLHPSIAEAPGVVVTMTYPPERREPASCGVVLVDPIIGWAVLENGQCGTAFLHAHEGVLIAEAQEDTLAFLPECDLASIIDDPCLVQQVVENEIERLDLGPDDGGDDEYYDLVVGGESLGRWLRVSYSAEGPAFSVVLDDDGGALRQLVDGD